MQTSRSGLVVLSSALAPIAADSEAIQILTFPDRPEKLRGLNGIVEKVRSRLLEQSSTYPPRFLTEFWSGKRLYHCRSFYFESQGEKNSHPAIALLLERKAGVISLLEVADRFDLTARELETVELLLQGLTSKEIADRMKISPNTVKAFLRLVMVKMGVSTRAGVIGRIVSPH
jgi:DNA-binding CsgD family transcriptional regulator